MFSSRGVSFLKISSFPYKIGTCSLGKETTQKLNKEKERKRSCGIFTRHLGMYSFSTLKCTGCFVLLCSIVIAAYTPVTGACAN